METLQMKDNILIKTIMGVCTLFCLFFLLSPITTLLLSNWSKVLDAFKDSFVMNAIIVSLKSTSLSIFVIVVIGLPTAYLLSRYEFKGKSIVETIIELPLVLPPAVAGLLLLITFGRNGSIGKYLYSLEIQIPLTFQAVLFAQVFVALPVFVKTAKTGLDKVDKNLEITALTLGDTPLKVIRKITFPLSKNALIAGAVLAYARALAEFGATIMFAGNLPAKTQTLPLAIYTAMEMDINLSLAIAIILVLISIVILIIVKKFSS